MAYLLIRHRVQDYAKWKPVFDEHEATRRANGGGGYQLLRSADDPNELLILFQWDDLGKARQFVQSDELREAMQRAGVAGPPDIGFLEEIERVS